MDHFVKEGYFEVELVSINRIRKTQESIFLSDLATAGDRALDRTLEKDDWRMFLEESFGMH